jgi:CheY-like chemotaxis protein
MRILLAEDNPLNQLVARELLRAEGALVEVADNGSLAVDAVTSADSPFDAVLMDMQMPVMDGCTAARTIRHELGNSHLPIIAMTANTMQSDREACLGAGMNDHVGKPFDINYLVEVLLQQTGRGSSQYVRNDGNAPATQAPAAEPLQVDAALRDMGGDKALYAMVLDAYLQELQQLPGQLEGLLRTGERSSAQRLVHTLKGTSATVGATALAAQALRLEREIANPQSDLAELAGMAGFRSAVNQATIDLTPIHAAMANQT